MAKNPSLYTDKAKTQAQVQAFIDANFTSQNKISVSNLTTNWPDKNTVDVTATATIDTYFAVVIGYNTLSTTIHAQALAAQNYLEVVLVLDNTGSMTQKASATDNTSKIEALKTAATDLANILFGDNATSDYVKIGVVPFTMAVNVGPLIVVPAG